MMAQTTGAQGVVKDAQTGETLPSVQVYFMGTTIGTITDLDGNYSIENTHDVEGHLNVSGIHILVLQDDGVEFVWFIGSHKKFA